MTRLLDRFDKLVLKAREQSDPARQIDYLLGALVGLSEWHFLNVGTDEAPRAAETEQEGERHWLVFSDVGRIQELLGGELRLEGQPPVITLAAAKALAWCVEEKGGAGILVNLGQEDSFTVSQMALADFYQEWQARGGGLSRGFLIPSMTSKEEDFWQEHGV